MDTKRVELAHRAAQRALVVSAQVDHSEIAAFLGRGFGEVLQVAGDEGLAVAGPPFGRYAAVAGGRFDVEAGFPVLGDPQPQGRVHPATLVGGTVAQTVHTGDYAGVSEAYARVEQWMEQNGYVPSDAPWESYLDEPDVPAPRTEVCFPCRPR